MLSQGIGTDTKSYTNQQSNTIIAFQGTLSRMLADQIFKEKDRA
jgi:hypothetical protein